MHIVLTIAKYSVEMFFFMPLPINKGSYTKVLI